MLQLTVDKQQTLKDFTDTQYAQASFCFRALLKDKEIPNSITAISKVLTSRLVDEKLRK